MHGNVWQWCADIWQVQLENKAVIDPYTQGDGGADRVVCGGSWSGNGWFLRSVYRYNYLGFRLFLGHEPQPSYGTLLQNH